MLSAISIEVIDLENYFVPGDFEATEIVLTKRIIVLVEVIKRSNSSGWRVANARPNPHGCVKACVTQRRKR